jgi:hypothetical protein
VRACHALLLSVARVPEAQTTTSTCANNARASLLLPSTQTRAPTTEGDLQTPPTRRTQLHLTYEIITFQKRSSLHWHFETDRICGQIKTLLQPNAATRNIFETCGREWSERQRPECRTN